MKIRSSTQIANIEFVKRNMIFCCAELKQMQLQAAYVKIKKTEKPITKEVIM